MFERIIVNRRVVGPEMRVAAAGLRYCRQRRRRWGRHAPLSSSSSQIQDNVLCPYLTVPVVLPWCSSFRLAPRLATTVDVKRQSLLVDLFVLATGVRKSFKAIGIKKTTTLLAFVGTGITLTSRSSSIATKIWTNSKTQSRGSLERDFCVPRC
jgi:hypothetical protein